MEFSDAPLTAMIDQLWDEVKAALPDDTHRRFHLIYWAAHEAAVMLDTMQPLMPNYERIAAYDLLVRCERALSDAIERTHRHSTDSADS